MHKPRESEVAGLIRFSQVLLNGRDSAAVVREYEQKVLKKEIDGLLLIPADVKSGRQVSDHAATSISDFATNSFIASTLRTVISQQLLLEKQIDPQVVREATRDVVVDTFKVKKEGTTKSSSGMDYIMSLFMMIILFGVLIGYGQMIMWCSEEKSSRISELLISSARSTHLFYGKVLGIGLAGLTQVALWILLSIVLGIALLRRRPRIHPLREIPEDWPLLRHLLHPRLFYLRHPLRHRRRRGVNTDRWPQQLPMAIVWMMLIPYFIGFPATQ